MNEYFEESAEQIELRDFLRFDRWMERAIVAFLGFAVLYGFYQVAHTVASCGWAFLLSGGAR